MPARTRGCKCERSCQPACLCLSVSVCLRERDGCSSSCTSIPLSMTPPSPLLPPLHVSMHRDEDDGDVRARLSHSDRCLFSCQEWRSVWPEGEARGGRFLALPVVSLPSLLSLWRQMEGR